MLDLGGSLVHWTTDSSPPCLGWDIRGPGGDSTLLSVTFNHTEELKLGCEGEDGNDKVLCVSVIRAHMCTWVTHVHAHYPV